MNELTNESSSGSGVIPGMHVQMTQEPARIGVPHHQPGDSPRIDLIRDGDVVKAIEVTCSCGKQIRLHCVY